jgi:hypothetical protein
MTEEQATEQFEKQVRERLEALRAIFAPLARELKPGDEPAPVFRPDIYPQSS